MAQGNGKIVADAKLIDKCCQMVFLARCSIDIQLQQSSDCIPICAPGWWP